MTDQTEQQDLLMYTTEIAAAYLSNNTVPAGEISGVIERVYGALSGLGVAKAALSAERPQPAVPIKHSITPDYLVCLEDGKQMKMLKRYLNTTYGMTPDQYRERWGLPKEYPMVAPNYAKKRSALAKDIGLGKK